MSVDVRKLANHRQFAIPLLCALMLAALWPIALDGDLYLHLKLGELISRAHHWIANDVFSYTDFGRPEETQSSWLAQWWFWTLYRAGGEAALRVFNFAIITALLTLAYRRAGIFGACVALVVHYQVQTFRPLVFGELGFAYFLFCEPRWSVLPLVVLWANLHPSVVAIIPFLFLRDWRLGALGALATFCNPQGPAIWIYALEVGRVGRALGIKEWSTIFPLSWKFLPRYALMLWAAAVARRDVKRWLLVAMAIVSTRHIAYLTYCLAERHRAIFGYTLLVVFGVWRIPPSPPSVAPAVQRLHGNVFNYPGWGSYLVFKRWPEVKVAHTMRLLVHEETFRFESTHSFAEIMRRFPTTDMILLPVGDPILSTIPRERWQTVYADGVAEILSIRSSATRE